MKVCQRCNSQMEDDAKFCSKCGMNLESSQSESQPEVAESQPVQEMPPVSQQTAVDYSENEATVVMTKEPEASVTQENEAEPNGVKTTSEVLGNTAKNAMEYAGKLKDTCVKGAGELSKKVDLSKIDLKKVLKVVGIVAAVLVVVLLIRGIAGLFSGGNKKEEFYSKMPVMFETGDGTVGFVMPGAKKVKHLSSEDETPINKMISDDAKYIFFGVGSYSDFDLYYRKTSSKDSEKAAVLIEKGVSKYDISPDGNTVFFTKNGRLYRSNRKKHVMYAKNVSEFIMAEDAKGVIYLNEDDVLYYSNGANKSKKLGEDVMTMSFSDDGKRVCWEDYDDGYYVCGLGKKDKKLKVASDPEEISFFSDFDKAYYVDEDGKLYFRDGKNKKKVLEDVSELLYCYDSDGEKEFFAEDYDDTFYILDGKKAKKLCENYRSSYGIGYRLIWTSDDEDNNTYYFRDGDELYKVEMPEDFYDVSFTEDYMYYTDGDDNLMRCKLSGKGFNVDKAKKLTDDVLDYTTNEETEIVYIYKNDNSFGVFDGKYKEVTDDLNGLTFVDGKKILFTEDYDDGEATLCLFNGKKSKVIAEDATEVISFGINRTYYLNSDNELLFTKGGKGKLLEEDVISLMKMDDYYSALSSVSEYK